MGGTALEKSGQAAQQGADALAAQANADTKSLAVMKKELADELQHIEYPLLVVLDDIDRLTPDEIRLLVQAVKANSDFPRVTFLMLCDRQVVAQALGGDGEEGKSRGEQFLKKIVQAGYPVPATELQRIESVLTDGVTQILLRYDSEKLFSEDEFNRVYLDGPRIYFETLRDVKRYLASLDVRFRSMVIDGMLQAHPNDLIFIEFLHIFEPDVYDLLPTAGFALTGAFSNALADSSPEVRKQVVENVITVSRHEEYVKRLLSHLFPRTPDILEGHESSGGRDDEGRRKLRIRHRDVFYRYFTYNIPEGQISVVKLYMVATLASDTEQLTTYLRERQERHELSTLIAWMMSYTDLIPAEHIGSFIQGLCNTADLLPAEHVLLLTPKPVVNAAFLVRWCIQRVPEDTRAAILINAFDESDGIDLPVTVCFQEDECRLQPNSLNPAVLSDTELPQVKEACIRKIRIAAQENVLQESRQFMHILYRWKEWDPSGMLQQWMRGAIEDEGILFRLLETAQDISRSLMGRIAINLDTIAQFVSLDAVAKRLQAVNEAIITNEQRAFVHAFREAYHEYSQQAIPVEQSKPQQHTRRKGRTPDK